jgi:hypothetical protein
MAKFSYFDGTPPVDGSTSRSSSSFALVQPPVVAIVINSSGMVRTDISMLSTRNS